MGLTQNINQTTVVIVVTKKSASFSFLKERLCKVKTVLWQWNK